MPITFRKHKAVTAATFEKRGGEWNPHAHFVVPTHNEEEAKVVQDLLDRYGKDVEAYAIDTVGDAETFSIELQFRDDDVATKCLKEYRSSKNALKKRKKETPKKAATSAAKKRLYKDRMYRLPDGELFWYYADWDANTAMGKVLDPLNGPRAVTNKFYRREDLRECDVLPKGEEPWKM